MHISNSIYLYIYADKDETEILVQNVKSNDE